MRVALVGQHVVLQPRREQEQFAGLQPEVEMPDRVGSAQLEGAHVHVARGRRVRVDEGQAAAWAGRVVAVVAHAVHAGPGVQRMVVHAEVAAAAGDVEPRLVGHLQAQQGRIVVAVQVTDRAVQRRPAEVAQPPHAVVRPVEKPEVALEQPAALHKGFGVAVAVALGFTCQKQGLELGVERGAVLEMTRHHRNGEHRCDLGHGQATSIGWLGRGALADRARDDPFSRTSSGPCRPGRRGTPASVRTGAVA